MLLGILLIGGKLYLDSKNKGIVVEGDKKQAILDCEKYRAHFNSFVNGTIDFDSLNISATLDSISASKIDQNCKEVVYDLIETCKQKQLDFLADQCQSPNINVLVDEFIKITLGTSFQSEAQDILDCIEYRDSSYQSDLVDFINDCENTAKNNKWQSSIWISKAASSKIFKKLNSVSSCQCCNSLKNEVTNTLNNWKIKHKYYDDQYELLTKSYKMLGSDGPRERTITDRASYEKRLNNLPVGSYYHNLHANSELSFHYP